MAFTHLENWFFALAMFILAFSFIKAYFESKKYARLSHDEKVVYNLERIRANTGLGFGGFILGVLFFIIVLLLFTGWLFPLLFLV